MDKSSKGKSSKGRSASGRSKRREKPFFDSVDPKVDFPKLERELLDYWYKKGIDKKYLRRNKNSKKYFSFIDGPITANNPMGVHHAWGRTLKDVWPRYKNMQGYRQRFQNGFDCQGLWVEVEVEKELNLKSKKDIENLVKGNKKKSIEKFINLCKERVYKFADVQTEQSKRLGYFADWDNSYYTLSDDNNYMIWYFLKVCHENGWIDKGSDSVPWCPRCRTAISQHEILTEDYKEVVHDSIYFALPIVEKEGESLLVWTTTPWTLPANIAVAVDKKLEYSLVEVKGRKYWLAKDTIKSAFGNSSYKVLLSQKGEKLVGLHYTWAFDNLPAALKVAKQGNPLFRSVIETDDRIMPITTEEGTGMVHTAVSAGTEDFKLGKKIGLPMIPVIDDNATYLDGLGEFSGKNAKDKPEIILNHLIQLDEKTDSNWVYKIERYKHRYPRCWRCKTELVWKVTDEWYILMDVPGKKDPKKRTLRKRLIDVTKKISWIPEFGLKRELDWLNNMHDWLISKKNRYWGLALPIYECKQCKRFQVIGSKEELEEKAVFGWDKMKGRSPHKPWIDEVEINCDKCGGKVKRIYDVGTPWLDAGIVAYSTVSSDNKSASKDNHKDAVPLYKKDKNEWRKWVPADLITESFPGQFKNWFYSLITMSTVLEDIEPAQLILGHATVLAEDGRQMHKSWGNAIEFNEGADKMGVDVMRWMYVRHNVSDNLLFGYKTADETRRRFHLKLWNIYSFFINYANLDKWSPTRKSPKPMENGKWEMENVLDRWILSRLKETVNAVEDGLDKYDANSASSSLEDFVNDLSNWYIRRSRDRVGPVAEEQKDKEAFYGTCLSTLTALSQLLAPFLPFISEIMYRNLVKGESVHLSNWPKIDIEVDKTLLEDMHNIRLVVEAVHALRKEKQIPVRQPLNSLNSTINFKKPDDQLVKYLLDEVNVKKWDAKKGSVLSNKFDTKITPELKEEAKTRLLIRNIQNERRNMGLNLTQKTKLISPWLPKSNNMIHILMKKTSTVDICKGKVFRLQKTS